MEAAALTDIERLHDKRWWTLGVLCLSLMIVIIGNSSLNVALPTLSRELHASESQLQWIVASYSLVFAGLLFSTGALGDRYGRKGTLQLGLAIFLVAATFAAFSGEMWQLIACRAVMGGAAALIMPATLSILINVFPPGERTKAIAIWASLTGAAGGFGPVISGWLLGHFWYGSVFLINVPVIMLALVAGRYLVPRSTRPGGGQPRPGRRGAVDHRRRGPRVRAHRGARAGLAERADDHRLHHRRHRPHAVRAVGAARRRADARHARCSATRRSAPARPG